MTESLEGLAGGKTWALQLLKRNVRIKCLKLSSIFYIFVKLLISS